MWTEVVDHFTKFKHFNLWVLGTNVLGITQILWALVGFLSLCQKISVLLEVTLSYAHVLILLLFFFCIFFFAFGCCFHVTFISVFFYLTVGLSITYLLSYVFMKISVHFRNFFCKIFGKFRVIAIGHHTALFTLQCSECQRQVS